MAPSTSRTGRAGKVWVCGTLPAGFGASEREPDLHTATVLATVLAAADGQGIDRFALTGSDIDSVDRFLLMDSVTFDSWPVPAVERFRNPGVRASMGVNEMVAAHAETTRKAVGRTLSEDEVADYVSPRKDPAS